MILSKVLLVAGYSCAQARAVLNLANVPRNQTDVFNFSNLTNLAGDEDAGIDPRFSVSFEDQTDDLSDKSTYMNALLVMVEQSQFSFEATSCGGLWSAKGYEDVEILMEGSIPGTITLQTRFMMWGLYYTVKRMASENFVATTAYLFWDHNGDQIHVGFVTIQRSTKSRHRRLAKRATDSNCGQSDMPSPRPSSAPPPSLDLQVSNAMNDSEEVSSFPGPNATLNAAKSRIQIAFEGPRLTKYGIFTSTLHAMVVLASFPRDRPAITGISLGDYKSQTQLDLRASGGSQTETGYLVYEKAIWVLRKVPKHMYSVNRFEQCTFVLLEGNVEVGRGSFKRNRFGAENNVVDA